jgi:kanamycin kinase
MSRDTCPLCGELTYSAGHQTPTIPMTSRTQMILCDCGDQVHARVRALQQVGPCNSFCSAEPKGEHGPTFGRAHQPHAVRHGTLGQMLAGPPRVPVKVPSAIEKAAAGVAVSPVWENEAGGLTFAVGAQERRFIKWAPTGSGIDLTAEGARLRWAADFTRVPLVIDHGADGEGSWQVTTGVPGENAVADRWKADPAAAVTAIGQGLRVMHDALPVATCPFSWSAEDRIADAHRRAAANRLQPARWHAVHRPLGVVRALELLADTPDIDELVVCHGDACAPNTLLTDDGACSGHVDLGIGRCRSVGRSRRRHVERRVELRPGLGGASSRLVRDRARRSPHPLLPPPLGSRPLKSQIRYASSNPQRAAAAMISWMTAVLASV